MVVKIDLFSDEGLPHNIVGSVIEVFGGERSAVNCLEAWVCLLDDMAFNQSHWLPPSLPASIISSGLRLALSRYRSIHLA
jgi:hypothetical protein